MTAINSTIDSEADLHEGIHMLVRKCEYMARAHAFAGMPKWRQRENGFAGLTRIIVGQQLSVASANAIWARLESTVQPFNAAGFTRKRNASLRKAGLSQAKAGTLMGIAKAINKGALNFDELSKLPDDDVRAQLIELKGVGPWTSDIYVMFCLGRTDSWAPGDLALQYAVQELFDLAVRPKEDELSEISERWRPWRAVAARQLWAYYRERKNVATGAPV